VIIDQGKRVDADFRIEAHDAAGVDQGQTKMAGVRIRLNS
jgi:hypothetical protein